MPTAGFGFGRVGDYPPRDRGRRKFTAADGEEFRLGPVGRFGLAGKRLTMEFVVSDESGRRYRTLEGSVIGDGRAVVVEGIGTLQCQAVGPMGRYPDW